MDEQVRKVVEEIEEEQALNKISAVQVFRSLLNQPNLISLNSIDKDTSGTGTNFSSLTFSLPRPILEAETIELVSATVPQCVQNIPDTACVFWYYRMNAYTGELPSINNLHFVRLLPSYYKKEFIPNPELYGYNQTFHSYQDVAVQLEKACKADLGNTNEILQSVNVDTVEAFLFESRFIPGDISITYNEEINKFQMTGNNVFKAPAYLDWSIVRVYAVGDRVVFEENGFFVSYQCLIANTGEEPSVTSLFWLAENDVVIDGWGATYEYGVNRIVVFQQELYQAIDPNINQQPIENGIPSPFWNNITEQEGFIWNRYLITGYNDPNVIKIQGSLNLQYDDTFLFDEGDVVDFQGAFYQQLEQSVGITPGTDANIWEETSTPIESIVSFENLITVACDTSIFIGKSPGELVYIVSNTNPIFNLYPTDGFLAYANVYILNNILVGGVELVNNRNFTVDTPSQYGIGGLVCVEVPPNIGLAALSGQFDFVFNDVGNIPPQPLNLKPRRLLNSILGFTWNGIFSNTEFGSTYSQNEPILTRIKDVDFLNRLRPVPSYTLIPTITPTLGATLGSAARTSGTYTADGFCNLVYSSTISIYATTIAGSTLNTSNNTGLLAMCSMDAGNLGVSFFQHGASAPLTINGTDIYTITFRFEDDFSEPYTLTNNAVVAMVLKIQYKNIV